MQVRKVFSDSVTLSAKRILIRIDFGYKFFFEKNYLYPKS